MKNPQSTHRLIIIGTGLAGYMLAKEWRKLNSVAELILITADDGGFYSKPLLSTALTQQKTPESLVISDLPTMARDLQATILPHSLVKAIDREQQQVILSNQSISYDQLVLACGAERIVPLMTGNAVSEIQAVNNLLEYRCFHEWLTDKQHIGIIGTGLVGCEFANDLVSSGYKVTMIAPDAYPLATLVPEEIGQQVQQSFAEHGVQWCLHRFALDVSRVNDPIKVNEQTKYRITLDHDEIVVVDGVFSAIGLRPNVELARSAGLIVNKGIVVDRHLRTSDPSIYAIGDCAEVNGLVKQYVAPILPCARTLAKVLTGILEPVQYPIAPIVIKTSICPVVVYPPSFGIIGEWQFLGDAPHMRGLFYDQQGQLQGYVLMGDHIRDKMSLAKQLPLVFMD